MWSPTPIVLTTLTLSVLTRCSNLHHSPKHYSRAIVTDGNLRDSYDFIIAGGGLAGLVLASRLSEDANTTVLVIEAGDTGDAVRSSIDVPANTYYTSLVGSSYDWAYKTVPQTNAGGRPLPWARGKVLGGSSAINGMYAIRPSEIEINAWQNLIATQDGAAANPWGWSEFFAAMKKAETFTPPSADIQRTAGITADATTFGTQGPLHVSYPGYTFPIVGNWTPSLEAIGIPTTSEFSNGKVWGGFVAASNINPTNWTRSYSKSAYIDPLPPRANLHILAGTTVTRLVFSDNSPSGNLTASGVEYASSSTAEKKTISVKKEVILAGGVLGSPQILMLSGVGPKDVLDAAGVAVRSELPGVGQHLQDHLSIGVTWQTSSETAGSVKQSGSSLSTSAEFLSFINSATAYVNSTRLFGTDGAAAIQNQIAGALSSSSANLVPSKSPEVVEGYKAIYNITANTIFSSQVGQVELLLSINAAGTIAIQAALQHPLSQGYLYISTPSAFDPITVDPQYFSHPTDVTILREGLKLARQLGQTAPINTFLGTETSPGSSVNSDDEWDKWLVSNAGTEYHPLGTCAMLPKSQGGVVNANLQVYGLANVRVADASVYPFSMSAHLGAPTYGLAEQAASIVRARYNSVNRPPSPTTNSLGGDGSAPSHSSTAQVAVRNISAVIISVIGLAFVLC